MANMHLISNQEKTTALSADSLFLISEPQNIYNTQWKSKAITGKSVGDNIEKQFRSDNFREDLDLLQDINDTYLNQNNLVINYDTNKQEIQLVGDDGAFSKFDASKFVTSGILENAVVKDGYLILTFKTASGESKEVKINLASLVDIYYAGNGLCCENKTFRINPDVVSIVGHNHIKSDITDFPDNISEFANDAGYLDKTKFKINYSIGNQTLWLSAGDNALSTKIESGGGVTYDYVHNELSNDGYGLKTVIRDWKN